MKSSGPTQLGIVMRPGQMIRRSERPASQSAPDETYKTKASNLRQTRALSTKIFVKGLMVEAECGVYAHEKGHRRPLVIDLEVHLDTAVRSGTDHLAETVDYDALVNHVRTIASDVHLHLIETFAEKICEALLADPRILSTKVRVEKPGAIPGAVCSGVELERSR
ncbi:dihydroneopterin aldolase [Candidatus Phycosocius spiralis]|uniref:7,8-dihydroneopterin aldolase n=1 Tax=Candidatus Phycosocius spiralis TaxID=2815099 RepID=A0ABQ4PWW5_9PROT|nr:dihydroneopterin aldolase [Candidatus Phycosocius spiralis]GIU67495.1 hypothetical protein PsB1_1649 [Candidatus Phycosocius spiralis]